MGWFDDLINSIAGQEQTNTNNSSSGANTNFSNSFSNPNSILPGQADLALGGIDVQKLISGNIPGGGNTGGGWMSTLFGGKDKNGFQTSGVVSPLASLLGAGAQAWLGGKQVGLAEDTLDFQKDAFSRQFNNQATLTNASLRDRQAVRYARDPNRYQSPDEYMKQNKVG